MRDDGPKQQTSPATVAPVGELVVIVRLRLCALPNPVATEKGRMCLQPETSVRWKLYMTCPVPAYGSSCDYFSMQAMATLCHLPGTRALHAFSHPEDVYQNAVEREAVHHLFWLS